MESFKNMVPQVSFFFLMLHINFAVGQLCHHSEYTKIECKKTIYWDLKKCASANMDNRLKMNRIATGIPE